MPKSRGRKNTKSNRNVQTTDLVVTRQTKFGPIKERTNKKVTINHNGQRSHMDTKKAEADRITKAEAKAWRVYCQAHPHPTTNGRLTRSEFIAKYRSYADDKTDTQGQGETDHVG